MACVSIMDMMTLARDPNTNFNTNTLSSDMSGSRTSV